MSWWDIGSSALGGLFSLGGTAMSNAMASAEAQKNRDWQERMSNTAHQREVADLRKAGLNPILSATGYSGASSPSGATAQVSDLGASATNAYRAFKLEKDKNKAEVLNLNQTAKESLSREDLNRVTQLKTGSEMNNLYEQGLNLQADRQKTYQDIENSKILTNAQAYNLINGSNASQGSARASLNNSYWQNTDFRRSAKFYKEHPYQSEFLRGVSEWTNAAGRLIKPR